MLANAVERNPDDLGGTGRHDDESVSVTAIVTVSWQCAPEAPLQLTETCAPVLLVRARPALATPTGFAATVIETVWTLEVPLVLKAL